MKRGIYTSMDDKTLKEARTIIGRNAVKARYAKMTPKEREEYAEIMRIRGSLGGKAKAKKGVDKS